ncbi:hypothetical protein [Sphingomonas sp. PAMC 26605]|nr:hypothetical protein [Sphingomonas sp. PAMC 26605]
MRLFDEINARPAAARVAALAAKYSVKQEMDAEARDHILPQNKRL